MRNFVKKKNLKEKQERESMKERENEASLFNRGKGLDVVVYGWWLSARGLMARLLETVVDNSKLPLTKNQN